MVSKIKVSKDPVRMRVRIRVLVSFNDVQKGDEAEVEWTPRVDAWIAAGLVEEVRDGTSEARQGGPEPDDHKRVPEGVEGSGTPGGEPGQGFGAGAYGAAPFVNPG